MENGAVIIVLETEDGYNLRVFQASNYDMLMSCVMIIDGLMNQGLTKDVILNALSIKLEEREDF